MAWLKVNWCAAVTHRHWRKNDGCQGPCSFLGFSSVSMCCHLCSTSIHTQSCLLVDHNSKKKKKKECREFLSSFYLTMVTSWYGLLHQHAVLHVSAICIPQWMWAKKRRKKQLLPRCIVCLLHIGHLKVIQLSTFLLISWLHSWVSWHGSL